MSYHIILTHNRIQKTCLCSHLDELKVWAEENAVGFVDFSNISQFQNKAEYCITFEDDIDRIAFILRWI